MNVYSLFDRKLRLYGQVFEERNDYSVQRMLADGVRGIPESLMSKHPDDFDLYQVGVFDEESGLLNDQDTWIPRLVCCVAELVGRPALSKEG